jgi:hypothetical protein
VINTFRLFNNIALPACFNYENITRDDNGEAINASKLIKREESLGEYSINKISCNIFEELLTLEYILELKIINPVHILKFSVSLYTRIHMYVHVSNIHLILSSHSLIFIHTTHQAEVKIHCTVL